MATQVAKASTRASSLVTRTLLLVWQDPDNRRFLPVAELHHLADGRFSFAYLEAARTHGSFFALDEYSDLDKVYVSDSLPVFFANRVMSPDRPDYGQYLEWLGLRGADPGDVPVEVLARTGGGRATDTFHVVDRPLRGEDHFESRFFVSGLRHVPGAATLLADVQPGDRLELRPEPDNVSNSKAVIIDVESRQQLGWVPDWLCGEVTEMIDQGWEIALVAERVNPDAPSHTRVLCRLNATSRHIIQS